MVTLADMPPVIHGPPQDNIAELKVLHRTKGGSLQVTCALERAQVECSYGQSVAIEVAARRPQQTSDEGACAKGVPQGQGVDTDTPDRPGAKTGGGQVGLADGPDLPGFLAEQVVVMVPAQGSFLAGDLVMLVERLDVLP